MKKIIIPLLLLFFCVKSFGQSTITQTYIDPCDNKVYVVVIPFGQNQTVAVIRGKSKIVTLSDMNSGAFQVWVNSVFATPCSTQDDAIAAAQAAAAKAAADAAARAAADAAAKAAADAAAKAASNAAGNAASSAASGAASNAASSAASGAASNAASSAASSSASSAASGSASSAAASSAAAPPPPPPPASSPPPASGSSSPPPASGGSSSSSSSVDGVPARDHPADRALLAGGRGAVLGARPRRVRRHDHVRRQPPRCHSDHAARRLQRPRVGPGCGNRVERPPARCVRRRPRRPRHP